MLAKSTGRLSLLGFLLLAPLAARAQTVNWIGANNGVWNTPANWSPGSVPGTTSDVVNATSNAIQINSAGQETVQSLTTSGLLRLNSGALTITGATTFSAGGSLLRNGGTLKDTTLTNSSSVSFSSATNIWDNVTLGVGQNLTLNGVTDSFLQIRNGLSINSGRKIDFTSANVSKALEIDTFGQNSSTYALNNLTLDFGADLQGFGRYLRFGTSSAVSGATSTLILGSNLIIQGDSFDLGTTSSTLSSGTPSTRTLVNQATINSTSGTWNIGDGNLTIVNDGTISATGAFPTSFFVRGASVVNTASGVIRSAASSTSQIRGALSNAGLIETTAGNLSMSGSTFSNTGTIRSSNNGNIAIGNSTATSNAGNIITTSISSNISFNTDITNLSGGSIVNNGRFRVFNGSLILAGGTLSGTGTVISDPGNVSGQLFNTGGIVSPGNSAGMLTIQSGYQQSGTGTLLIELGGTSAGQFDVLAVTGMASLGGTLELTQLAGFSVADGQSFDILTADNGITGSFTTIHTTGIDPSLNAAFAIVPGPGGAQIGRVSFSAAIPEPAALALLALGSLPALTLLGRNRLRFGVGGLAQKLARRLGDGANDA
jgi:hypothetical protein